MVWKHTRGAKIFTVTIPALVAAGAIFVHAQKPGAGALQRFDQTIREKSVARDSIKSELERGRSRILALQKKEGTFLEQLQVMEKNIESSRAYLDNTTDKITALAVHIDALKDSLSQVTAALSRRQASMKKRLREMYKTGTPELLEILITSGDVAEMLTRIRYFEELNRYDRTLLRAIDSTRAIVVDNKRRLEEEQAQLIALRAEKEAEVARLAADRKKRETVLLEVTNEKKTYESMVRELEKAQAELHLLVQTLQKKKKIAEEEFQRGLKIAFEKRKGKLPWPAEGAVVREFGAVVHPVYKTVTMSNGIDIQAPKGVNVVSVAPGRIDYVGWMRGYGKFVIVNHSGGYLTIYAHLDQIAVAEDQEVAYGTVIGTAGETGSLTGPKLHFQIRRSAETLDPRPWLEKRE